MNKSRVRISFAALLKPASRAGFNFFKQNFAKELPRNYQYRNVHLVKSNSGWYVEFYYLVPRELQEQMGKKWERFRIREDMNRRKGQEREEYADYLLGQITEHLKTGRYNPFEPLLQLALEDREGLEEPELIDAEKGLLMFLDAWRKRGLDPASIYKYERIINRLIEWLAKMGINHAPLENITSTHIEKFFTDTMQAQGFGNREYNNHYDFTRTAFNFFVKKKIISESPLTDIRKLKAKTSKHRFYDTETLEKLRTALKVLDPYVLLAFQTVYYLCVRSDKELKNLKVGNILWDQDKVLAEVGKGNTERYIPLDENMKKIFLDAGIDKYPPEYYIFGIDGVPSEKKFGIGFFAKRFRKARDKAGIGADFTLYGAKHTRVVHLKSDGAADADIMNLTGHKDFSAYAKYLRDLGMSADASKLNKISRKI